MLFLCTEKTKKYFYSKKTNMITVVVKQCLKFKDFIKYYMEHTGILDIFGYNELRQIGNLS